MDKKPRAGSKTAAILEILSDGKPHSTFELVRRAYKQNYASCARVGAIIFELKTRYGKIFVAAHSEKNPTKYWYCIVPDVRKTTLARAAKSIDQADMATGEYK